MKLFKFLRKEEAEPESREEPTRVAATQISESVAPSRIVVVGLDFGTSSIKVALRELTARKKPVALLDFGTQLDGYSRFAYPSSISIRSEAVRTGVDAEVGDPGGSLRSVKMRLLRGASENRDWPDWLPRVEGVELPEAEFASALLLTAAMQEARRAVEDDFGTLENVRILYNLDVPVDEFDGAPSHRTFYRVLRTAHRLTDRVVLPCRRNEVVEAWLSAAFEVAQDGTPEEERSATVVGEAQAILAGISDAIKPEPHRPYVIVDIGAGTTDIGIFRLSTWSGEDRVNFFSAGTCRIGCDDLDEALCRIIWHNLEPAALQATRVSKLQVGRGRTSKVSSGGRPKQVRPENLLAAVDSLGADLIDYYVSRWREAFDKARNPQDWTGAGLVVVGGGSMVLPLQQLFAEAPGAGPVVQGTHLLNITDTSNVRVIGASDRAPNATDLLFLTAARGLSYGKPQLRELVTSHQIEAVSLGGRRPTGAFNVDADDLYSE